LTQAPSPAAAYQREPMQHDMQQADYN
jgi:hypothetical protein